MTDSAYPLLTDVEKAFKAIVWDPMIKAGETWIEVQAPFLDLPVIKQLDEAAINAITDAIYAQIVIFIDVTAIKLKNDQMQSAWSTAAESLTLISQEQGVSSDAYKKALSEAAADFAKWVHTGDPA